MKISIPNTMAFKYWIDVENRIPLFQKQIIIRYLRFEKYNCISIEHVDLRSFVMCNDLIKIPNANSLFFSLFSAKDITNQYYVWAWALNIFVAHFFFLHSVNDIPIHSTNLLLQLCIWNTKMITIVRNKTWWWSLLKKLLILFMCKCEKTHFHFYFQMNVWRDHLKDYIWM